MLKKILEDNSANRFVAICMIVFITIMILENINGRFSLSDFKVYYMAAEALLNNDQVYGLFFGKTTGYYKYSPFTLIFFIPYTLISYKIASIIHFIVIGCSAIASILIIRKIIHAYLYPVIGNLVSLIFILLCVLTHLFWELHLGNVNIILIMLLSLALKFLLESRVTISALLLAITIMTKFYFIILILPLLLYKQYKLVTIITFFIFLFTLSLSPFIGFAKNLSLYFEWFSAMMQHSSYLVSHHTIFSLIHSYTGLVIQSKYHIPFFLIILVLFSLTFFCSFIYSKMGVNTHLKVKQYLIIHFFILIATIPSFLITDTEHFLFSLPLIEFIILYFFSTKNKPIYVISLIALMLFYGGDIHDLLGKKLSGIVGNLGLLGISNLGILGFSIILFLRKRKVWNLGMINT